MPDFLLRVHIKNDYGVLQTPTQVTEDVGYTIAGKSSGNSADRVCFSSNTLFMIQDCAAAIGDPELILATQENQATSECTFDPSKAIGAERAGLFIIYLNGCRLMVRTKFIKDYGIADDCRAAPIPLTHRKR